MCFEAPFSSIVHPLCWKDSVSNRVKKKCRGYLPALKFAMMEEDNRSKWRYLAVRMESNHPQSLFQSQQLIRGRKGKKGKSVEVLNTHCNKGDTSDEKRGKKGEFCGINFWLHCSKVDSSDGKRGFMGSLVSSNPTICTFGLNNWLPHS